MGTETVQGMMFGIGDAESRINEITPQSIAALNYLMTGYDYREYPYSGTRFGITVHSGTQGNNYVDISPGILVAYGYSGVLPETVRLYFNLPSVKQYWYIVATLDLSVVPAAFTVKAVNNHASDRKIFRQDNLNTFPTGIFEYPLYRIAIDNSGIITGECVSQESTRISSMSSIPGVINTSDVNIADAENADYAEVAGYNNNGVLSRNIVAKTQSPDDNSRYVATTAYVDYLSNFWKNIM